MVSTRIYVVVFLCFLSKYNYTNTIILYYKFQIKGPGDERIRKKLQPTNYNAVESISEMEQNEYITKSM